MEADKEAIQRQFGVTAEAYVQSQGHATGADLERIAQLAQEVEVRAWALDVATGGGHTARTIAPYYTQVVLSDLTEPMLRAAYQAFPTEFRGQTHLVQADAECLPFLAASFDLVTCRIAPHHFKRPAHFVQEVTRILRPGGRFILVDSTVPRDPTSAAWLNSLEGLRDPTHHRTLSVREWTNLVLDSRLRIRGHDLFPKRHALLPWLARSQTPGAQRAEVMSLCQAAPPEIRQAYRLEYDEAGTPIAFTDFKLLLWADKG